MEKITSIKLTTLTSKEIKFKNLNDRIEFSHLNLLIGQNNSGKSKFARSILKSDFKTLSFDLADKPFKEIFDKIDLIRRQIQESFISNYQSEYFSISSHNFVISNEMFLEVLKRDEFYSKNNLDSLDPFINSLLNLKQAYINNASPNINYKKGVVPYTSNRGIRDLIIDSAITNIDDLFRSFNFAKDCVNQNFQRFYIPIIRGLRAFQDINEEYIYNPYKERTNSDYFINEEAEIEIRTGLEFYEALDEMVRGSHEMRKKVDEYETFLSQHFFSGQDVNLIPKKGIRDIVVKIGENDEHPIYEFGDGLQGLIICTFFAFVNKSPGIFVLEEPDAFMHPGMQRKFIEILHLDVFKKHQFFITTHSNHMIDLSNEFSDVSVIKFEKRHVDGQSEFRVNNIPYTDRDTLWELGVRNSSALIANSMIWVEGISDRLIFKHLFGLYLKKIKKDSDYKEDIHFTFLEYQGSNLPHFVFDDDKVNLSFISPNSLFILDGDIKYEKPRWPILLKDKGVEHLILDCKEIECLIPSSGLQKYFEDINKLEKTRASLTYGNIYNSKDSTGRYISLASYIKQQATLNEESLYGTHILSSQRETFIKKAEFARAVIEKDLIQLNSITEPICKIIYDLVYKANL